MICIGNLKKNPYISVISIAKLKCFIVFACTYVPECSAQLYGDFCMNSHSVYNNEAMKQGNEALNASLLQFFTQC
jgi:hypothetical protein